MKIAYTLMEVIMTELHERVLQYQLGNYGWFSLYQDLYLACRNYLCSLRISQEEAHEFFYWALPRLRRICDSYSYRGKDFRNLLFLNIDWLRISYRRFVMGTEIKELEVYQSCYTMDNGSNPGYLEEFSCGEEPAVYQAEQKVSPRLAPKAKEVEFRNLSNRSKKILLISFLNSLSMDDFNCHRVATETGLPLSWIHGKIDTLRAELIPMVQKKHLRRLASMGNLLTGRSKRPSKYLGRFTIVPTHQRLSELLGIPKGTIAGIIYSCRRMEKLGKFL